MKQYRFCRKLNQAIVDGILQGHKNYLLEKREKMKTMHISYGYAWVRENHIDDQVASYCKRLGFQYKAATAGSSWRYLQFFHEERQKMFVVKNERYLQDKQISPDQDFHLVNQLKNQAHYLYKLAQINQNIESSSMSEQLTLPFNNHVENLYQEEVVKDPILDDELRALQEKLNLFYIVSYAFNPNYYISKIQLLLPSPYDGQTFIVEDISSYIMTSTVDFSHMNPLKIVEKGEVLGELIDMD